MVWAAVIGDPISHSRSPALHLAAYRLLGLDWEYRAIRVDQEQLGPFMRSLPPDCAGLSVTMPDKRAILEHTDVAESLVKTLKVANTVVIQAGLKAAFNTDVYGITEALRFGGAVREADGEPLVIGNGATACSALAALGTLGYRSVRIAARNLAGADGAYALAAKLGISATGLPLRLQGAVREALAQAPIVISTIPPAALTPFVDAAVRPGAVLLDVTYSSSSSPLDAAFQAQGATSVNPLVMLTYQGIAQVKLMTSREVPFEPMYKAVVEARLPGAP